MKLTIEIKLWQYHGTSR